MLACQSEVELRHIDGLWEVLAHQAGCEAWPGGEENCVYSLAPGINDGTKAGPVKEMYNGRECINVVSAVCETV